MAICCAKVAEVELVDTSGAYTRDGVAVKQTRSSETKGPALPLLQPQTRMISRLPFWSCANDLQALHSRMSLQTQGELLSKMPNWRSTFEIGICFSAAKSTLEVFDTTKLSTSFSWGTRTNKQDYTECSCWQLERVKIWHSTPWYGNWSYLVLVLKRVQTTRPDPQVSLSRWRRCFASQISSTGALQTDLARKWKRWIMKVWNSTWAQAS